VSRLHHVLAAGFAAALLSTAAAAAEAPPPVPQIEYFVAEAGNAVGPMPLEEVQRRIKLGTLRASDLVWRTGTDDWRVADSYEELAGTFEEARALTRTSAAAAGDDNLCPSLREWEEMGHATQGNSWYDVNNKDSLSFYIRQSGCKPRGPFQ
jgi:hypothetical protein